MVAVAILLVLSGVNVPGGPAVGAPANGPSSPVVGVSGVWTPSSGAPACTAGTLNFCSTNSYWLGVVR